MFKKLKYHLFIFLILQISLYLLYGYGSYYNARPGSIHQWRQTDCLSFTKNYYEEGMHFFSPKIHWQSVEGGKTISEFPLMNYSVAVLWKVFGEHEYIYRFLELLIYTTALLFLFVMVFVVSDSLLYAYLSTLLISSSPLLAYYSFNFLADVPALSFAIIAMSLYVLHLKNKKLSYFICAVAIASLAVLLKASAAPVLMVIGALTLMHIFGIKTSDTNDAGPLYRKKIVPLTVLLSFGLLIIIWYRYALVYNSYNKNGVFLMDILPIWKMKDKEKIYETGRYLFTQQFSVFFNKGVLTFMFCALMWLLLNLKTLSVYLRAFLLVSAVTFLVYLILFFEVFNVHDYYLINEMILPIVVMVCLGDYLKKNAFDFKNKKLVVVCVALTFFNSVYCASFNRMRNIKEDKFVKRYPFISNEEFAYWNWFHWNYDQTYRALETITPYLREIGITRTDQVLSMPDPSFNVTLYLMDQKGYTGTAYSLQQDTNYVQQFVDKGAKYLIINNADIKKEKGLEKYLGNKYGQYKNIEIYKLTKP